MKLNTYQLAKKELSDIQVARANTLVKLKTEQEGLDLLKDDMISKDAADEAVARYNDSKRKALALRDVLEEYDRVRLPQADANVRHEKSVVMAAVSKYLQEKKIAAVPAIQKKFNEAVKLMDKYSKEVAEYVSANGNVLLVGRKLKDITLFDMDTDIKKRLR